VRKAGTMPLTRVLARCVAFGLLALAGCVTRPGAAAFARSSQVSVSYGLEGAHIIYIAEKHDEAFHHQFQEDIIRSLHRQGKPVTVGMEMVDLTQQAALDDYLNKRGTSSCAARRSIADGVEPRPRMRASFPGAGETKFPSSH